MKQAHVLVEAILINIVDKRASNKGPTDMVTGLWIFL